MKTLIVDDNPDDLYLLETLLKSVNYSVDTASDGQEALNLLKEGKYDLVISDILMPVLDGYQLCLEIRADYNLKAILFVFLSAEYTEIEDERFSTLLGADGFVKKPIQPDKFIKMIQDLAQQYKEGKIPSREMQIAEKKILKLHVERLTSKLEGKIGLLEDEIKKNEIYQKTLKEREQKYIDLFNSTPIPTLEADFSLIKKAIDKLDIKDTNELRDNFHKNEEFVVDLMDLIDVTEVNQPYLELFKYRNIGDINTPYIRPVKKPVIHSWIDTFIGWLNEENIFSGEITSENPTRGTIPLLVHRKLIPNKEEPWSKVIITVHDISRIRSMEKIIEEKDDWFKAIEATISEVFWETDIDRTITHVSPSCYNVYGYKPEEFLGKSGEFLSPDSNKSKMKQFYKDFFKDPRPMVEEFSFIHKDGHEIHIVSSIVPHFDVKGELVKIRWADRDITDRKIAENKIKENEEHYRVLFENAPEAILIHDTETNRYVDANSNALEMFKINYNELHNINPSELSAAIQPTGETAEELIDKTNSLTMIEKTFFVEWLARDLEGREFLAEVRLAKLPSVDRKLVRASVIDISEKKKNELILKESEERYRVLFENAPEAILIHDIETNRYVDANTNALEMFKINYDDLNTTSPSELSAVIQPSGKTAQQLIDEATNQTISGKSAFLEWMARDLEGREFPAEIRLSVLPSMNRKLVRASVVDISEKKKNELILKESEERYRVLVENAPEAILVFDQDRNQYIDANLHALNLFKINRDILETISPQDLAAEIQSDGVSSYAHIDNLEVLSGEITSLEWMARDLEGRVFPTEIRMIRLPTAGRELLRLTVIDISERKIIEEKLFRSREMYLDLYDNAPVMFVSIDPKTKKIIRCNQTTAKSLGYNKEEIVGRLIFDFYHPDSDEDAKFYMKQFSETGIISNAEMKIIRKDGSPLDVILDVTALYDENGIIKESRSVWRDVSEMKKAQRRIIDIQAKLQTIINNLPLILWSTDTNGIYNLSDGQGLQKIGFEPGQLVGQSLFDVYSDNPAIIEANRRALDGETFETTNQIGETSYESYYAPQVDAEDNIIGVIGLAFDVTDRLQTEKALEESKQQLVQSQKMEAIGRLAGGIAHDFNNQLTGILGYSSFLLTKLSDEDELRSAVKEIEEAGEKSASLVKQLLTFSRKQNIAPKVINLNDILKNTLKMLKRVIGEDIKLETKLDPNLGNINADPTQINQIIMNLAVNSREAMIDGGRLTISTENLIKTDFPTGDKSQKPVVALIISDTGIGMSEETISRIFEPFFTTKEHGTGLGLATVYGIIKQNLGEIEVESQLGKGTTFTVFLPQTLEKVCTKIDDVTHISKQRATADILIVEDEDSLRRLAKLILEDQGYQVVDTDHPRKALSIVELKNFDLIISDVIMPGMNGLELIRKIKKKVQKLRVLFITGYIEQPLFKEIIKENYTILEKPFSRTTFLKRVEELLEE